MIYLLRYFLCLLPLLLPPAPAAAQILNVEKARIDKDSAHYFTGSGAFNLQLFNRNAGSTAPSNFTSLTGTADLAYLSGRHSYYVINNYTYTSVKRNPIVRTGYSHFRVNWLRKRRLSYENFAQYQYDLGRGLALRLLGGGGVRLQLRKTDDISFYLGSGLMQEHEEWRTPGREESPLQVVNLLKSTSYLSTRARINPYVEANGITYFQTGYDRHLGTFRSRLSGEANLMVKVTTKLRFRTNFTCTYENRPIVPITKFIYSLTNGIQYSF